MANKGTGIFKYLHGDKGIWCIMLILSFISIAAVYSSTGRLAYLKQGGDTTYYVLKHAVILLSAWGVMYGVHRIRYTYFARLSVYLIWPVIILLIVTLTMGTVNDASRWIRVGPLSFQPSEPAKLVLIVFLARQLTKFQPVIKESRTFLSLIWAPLLVCGLIFPENLSTSLILLLTGFVMLVVGGISNRYVWSMVGAGSLFVLLMLAIFRFVPSEVLPGRFATWQKRVESFTGGNREESGRENSDGLYQVTQARIAVAGGQLFGKGPGNSTQRNFLPHPYSDYIYALIIEEYGMVTGVAVLFLYLWFLRRGISVARRCPGSFGSYMVLGITFLITLQALVNMGVAVDLLPVTGQPLPFLSMGGTSLWFTALGVGMVLSVSVAVEKHEAENRRENVKA